MSHVRLGPELGQEEQPSHRAIDNGNPAVFKVKWLVLDDVNVDILSGTTILAAAIAVFYFGVSPKLAAGLAAAFVLPLRFFLPHSKVPQGLVLITGASSGIGAELSYIFASKGHDLILVGRNEEQLQAVQKNIQDKYQRAADVLVCDLSVTGSAKKLYEHVKKQDRIVDVLVNGAGLGGAGSTLEQPIEFTERMTILNCVSPVQLTQLFGNDMIERRRGWLLHISSVGGKFSERRPILKIMLTNDRMDGFTGTKHIPCHQALRSSLFRSLVCRIACLSGYCEHSAHARSHPHPIHYSSPRRGNIHDGQSDGHGRSEEGSYGRIQGTV